jgi:streptogramin lyase
VRPLIALVVVVTAFVPALAAGPAGAWPVAPVQLVARGMVEPTGITLGPDGNIWFTNDVPQGGSIGRITPGGVVSNFSGSGVLDPREITAGPDGALWFTNFGNMSIGRISTTGVVTNFPNMGYQPSSIAAGPDGALWFISDAIHRLTPSGVLSTYPAAHLPVAVARGADGSLLFIGGTAPIWRITPAGTVQEFTDPAISYPAAVTSTPDGTVWFTTTVSVGRVTPAGVVTMFPVPGARQLAGITVGPDGNLWVVDHINAIDRISPTGLIVTFPNLAAPNGGTFSHAITTGSDGNLWFTNTGIGEIGRITPSGVTTGFTGNGISGPTEIRQGPDGNMWVIGAGRISRITAAGTVTNFTDPALASPAGLINGDDGAQWFTNGQPLHTSIGRIDTNGVITTFTSPSLWAPSRLVRGPNSTLWFTDGATIDKIDLSGHITTFSGPLINQPLGLALGPDGNMWFTDISWNDVARITPDGVVTAFTDPAVHEPRSILLGADGNLWFANTAGNSLGRITTAGTITIFSDPSIQKPDGLVRGRDGNIWFTETGANAIGRVTPDGTLSSFADPRITSPHSLTAGPDGNLWFVWGVLPGHVAKLSPTGALTVLNDVTLLQPAAIATGPDGFMWFTDVNDSSIYRFNVALRPLAPASVSVQRSDPAGTAIVQWTPPANDGGSLITAYTVSASPGGATCAVATGPLQCTLAGLQAGTTYTVTVVATNAVGTGAAANAAPFLFSSGNPIGSLDAASLSAGQLVVAGWTLDPDTSASIPVAVYIDGHGIAWFPAADPRRDVGAAQPGYGDDHGFRITVPVSAGAHQVCVYAINAGAGSGNPVLGCRTLTPGDPIGALDAAIGQPGALRVTGWALDRDTTDSIPVAVYLDGHGVAWYPTNVRRPDIAAVFPGFGDRHGYDITIAAVAGGHKVCTYGINEGPGTTNALLGCRAAQVT